MKIICIEEHAIDGAIAKATQAAQAKEAPYMTEVGDRGGEPKPQGRPHFNALKDTLERAKDIGAGRIKDMDEHGISIQVLSYSNAVQLAKPDEAIDLARTANDRLAEAVEANPTRFQGFATLPWQNPEAAAVELERAVKQLGLKGTMCIGRPGETFLDYPRFEPVMAKLNELKVPLYVHPGPPLPQVQAPYYGGFKKEVTARLSLFGWGWHNEAGVHVIRMILSGQFDKFPNLNVISGHWGEMVPFYLQRMDDSLPPEVSGLKRRISETYRDHVYVTPSGMLTLPHCKFIHEVCGADRLIYAIDYPYLTQDGAREFLESLPISEEDREKFAFRNAERLFGI